ncbi:MAG: PIN domain-containing protein [Desulfurobacteriaceae bacterium]
MIIEKVFVDANVIIDLFEDRTNSHYSISAIEKLLKLGVELFTSCDLITTIYYVLSKVNKEKALNYIEDSMSVFTLIPFSNKEVIEAVSLMKSNSNFKDLEDTIQYVLAKKEKCDLILTNDKRFFSPDIKIFTAKEVCEDLGIK